MVLQLSAMIIPASRSGHMHFALAASAPPLWQGKCRRHALAGIATPERFVRTLPLANAPPGTAGGGI